MPKPRLVRTRPSLARPHPPEDLRHSIGEDRFVAAPDVAEWLRATAIPSINSERWAVIHDWPNYAVSDRGRVKRLVSRTRAKAGTILRATLRSPISPYPCVSLCRDGCARVVSVHQLVMAAFVGLPPPGFEINHIDGDKTNPALANLEYVTSSRNKSHAYDVGLADARGQANGQARLTDADVVVIRKEACGRRGEQAEIARRFGVSPSTIRDVLKGRTWSHIGASNG